MVHAVPYLNVLSHMMNMVKVYCDLKIEKPVWEEWKRCKKLKELELGKDISNSDLLGFFIASFMDREQFILKDIKLARR